ncbi:MAG0110 family membrane protein [Mycoplasma simbae]|uniref:MAG0110 family membrane protein n=1 Tax=Mycoplasma simbae TaxID=36744 RepID=UPI0004964B8D|nr:US12 family protein [Mycoplasma simbae]
MNTYKTINTKAKEANKIISGSILSFAINLILAILGGIAFLLFTKTTNGTYKFEPISFMIATVLSIILIFTVMMWGPKMKVWVLAPLTTASMLLIGYTILGIVFLTYEIDGNIWKLMTLFFIPTAGMLIAGTLAFFNKINIGKISTVAIFGSIFLFIFAIVSWFVTSRILFTLISTLGIALVFLYMMIDWYIILKFNKHFNTLEPESQSKSEVAKWSLYFGYRLSYDFVIAISYLNNLLSR